MGAGSHRSSCLNQRFLRGEVADGCISGPYVTPSSIKAVVKPDGRPVSFWTFNECISALPGQVEELAFVGL